MRGAGFFWIAVWVLAVSAASCLAPKTVRVGPKMSPRPADCEILVLGPGAVPSRPYRDIGLVELENCQDYQSLPCRKWLTKAACKLGGQVAYLPGEGGPVLDSAPVYSAEQMQTANGSVTYRILVAAFVADLDYDLETDPVANSRRCQPSCKVGERCVGGACQRTVDCKAEQGGAGAEDPDDFESGRCPE